MASIWKDPRSRFWVACFTDHNGKRRKRSTFETSPSKAKEIAVRYEKVARSKQTPRSVRDTISSLAKELWSVDVPRKSIKDFVAEWLAAKKEATAESTLDFYSKSCGKFLAFLGEDAERPIEEIDKTLIERFKADIKKSLAAKTVNHHLKLLRMLFKDARREGLIDDDPAEFVKTIKKEETSIRRPFSEDELKAVVAVAPPEWRSMVILGLYTGQRLADIACMTWANIDLKNGEIRIEARKTGKKMKIPIGGALKAHLLSLGAPGAKGPLHPHAADVVTRLGKAGPLSNEFSGLLVKAGLRDEGALNKQGVGKGRSARRTVNELSFHSLRHTAVTLLKEAGIPAAVVMELIGHDSAQMSEHYTHVGQEAMRKAAEALPDLVSCQFINAGEVEKPRLGQR